MARILIIDGDKPFREALAESVRDFGHDVVEASRAQEAFMLIEEADVAFLDLKMPNMSGIDFLREAKPVIPVVVLTAYADSSNTIEAIRLGAFDHLTKPIGRTDLQRVLHAALQGPFVPVNCAAIPRDLLESELFGHVKGAFTGAFQPRQGKFREADRGTLFLDEIGDMPLEMQANSARTTGQSRCAGRRPILLPG